MWHAEFMSYKDIFDAFPYITNLEVILCSNFLVTRLTQPLSPQRTHLTLIEISAQAFVRVVSTLLLVRTGIFPNLEDVTVVCSSEGIHGFMHDCRWLMEGASRNTFIVAGVTVIPISGRDWILPSHPHCPSYP